MWLLKMLHTLVVLKSNIFQNKIRKFITNKNVTLTFYRIPAYDLIMCKYFCIVFLDFMLLQVYNLIMCESFCIVFIDFMLQGD